MARVLLIDDDPALLDALTLAFEGAGHVVARAKDGRAGLDAIRKNPPQLVITDVNMPVLDGFALCRELRAAGVELPIILLTSRDTEIDEALGLELGADDYISKPFSTRILLARVAALLRRDQLRASDATPRPTLSTGALTLDSERLEVRYREALVPTTVTEFRLLELLARRPGVVFTRAQLLDLLRGDEVVVEERLIDTYVRRLRRKLEAIEPAFDRIETVIGAGYRWRE